MSKYLLRFFSLFLFIALQIPTTAQTFQSIDIARCNSMYQTDYYTQGFARISITPGVNPMWLTIGCQGSPQGPFAIIVNNLYIPSNTQFPGSYQTSCPFNLDQLAMSPNNYPPFFMCYFHVSSTPLAPVGPYPPNTWVDTKTVQLTTMTDNNINLDYQGNPPVTLRTAMAPGVTIGDQMYEFAKRTDMPNIDLSAADNPPTTEYAGDKRACVVAATTNSMMWMNNSYNDFKLPQGMTQRDLLRELSKMMKRRDTTGVMEGDMITGKLDFAEKYNLPMEVKFQDFGTTGNIGSTSGKSLARNFNVKENNVNKPPTWEFLMKMMKDGEDVEIQYEWYDSAKNKWYAHSVVMSEIIKTVDGKKGIKFTHDWDQSKIDAKMLDNPFYYITTDAEGFMRFDQYGRKRIRSIVAESPIIPFGREAAAWLNELVVNPYQPTNVNRQIQVLTPYIEIALHSSITDLANYKVTLYNGDTGLKYLELTLDQFTPCATSNGLKFYSYTFSREQINQTHGGVGVSHSGSPIIGQFWSYGGIFLALDGDFTQMWTTELGPVKPGRAFALAGSGTNYKDFSWTYSQIFSLCTINPDQYYGAGGPSVPVITNPLIGTTQPTTADFTWTDSTAGATFDYMVSEDSTFVTTFAQETNYSGLTKQIQNMLPKQKILF